jgi:hypothetical protein
MREFDTPSQGWPKWIVWGLISLGVLAALVVVAGFVGGVGPLRALGLSTTPLEAVQYRTTPDPSVLEVAVAMPKTGLCRDDTISVTAFERGNRVEIDSSVTRPRKTTCPVSSIGGDVTWVSVPLDEPLAGRTVIRLPDRSPLEQTSAVN